MKAFNWKGNKHPEDNQVHDVHMHMGISMMNNELLVLIDEMSDFLRTQSKFINMLDITSEMSNVFDDATFEKTTFGRQVRIFVDKYKNPNFNYDRLSVIVTKRNYYIHHFKVNETKDFNKPSRDLYDLIHTIIRARNAIEQIKDRINKELNKNKFKQKNHFKVDYIKEKLNQTIIECSDCDGWANMAFVGNQLLKKNIDYKKLSSKYRRLKSILEELGYEIGYDGKVAYVHKK